LNLRSATLSAICLIGILLAQCEAQTITPKHSRKFIRFDNCEFVPTSYVDGDSFRVRIGTDEFVLRLYYVDCPEADDRFPDRNAEQAQYFGITDAESLAVGKAAKEYLKEVLTGKAITVFTRWSSAISSSRLPRYYALVEVDGRNLGELLVENGLARLHGVSVNLPDGTKINDYIPTLAELENAAKKRKVGAWATSKAELQHISVEEVRDTWETPRWLDRLIFAGAGAISVILIRLVGAAGRKRRESRVNS